MTDPPQGRDGSLPSVAALAVHVSSLARDVESLSGKLDELASTQRQHAVLLEGLAELRRQIDHFLSILTEQDDERPATWFWLTMPEQERAEKFAELTDWVETVLRAQYPDYLKARLLPCWLKHPEVRWELAWLYQLWSTAYLGDHPAPRDAADWHDRWFPGVVHRVTAVMRHCEEDCVISSSRSRAQGQAWVTNDARD